MIESRKGFYVGDICHVLGDRIYHGIWGAHGYEDGEWTDPETGLSFAVAGTVYGDGTYFDEVGNEYPVDAGVIGVVPLELVEKEDGLKLGTVVYGNTASLEVKNGWHIIQIDDEFVEINTGEDEYPEDDWHEEEEDDSEYGYDPYLGCYTDDV